MGGAPGPVDRDSAHASPRRRLRRWTKTPSTGETNEAAPGPADPQFGRPGNWPQPSPHAAAFLARSRRPLGAPPRPDRAARPRLVVDSATATRRRRRHRTGLWRVARRRGGGRNRWLGPPRHRRSRGAPPPYGPLPAGGSGASSSPHRKRRAAAIALGAIALASAAAGAGVGVAMAPNSPASTGLGAGPPSHPSGVPSSTLASRVAAAVDPAVVDVTSTIETDYGPGTAKGTGMIITSSGDILTNNHVVEGATAINVSVEGHRTPLAAEVLGVDPSKDVAVIKVKGLSGLPTVRLGNSSTVTVGTEVVAIGNALGLGGTPTVTTGTITNLNRTISASDDSGGSETLTGMLQTDAPIVPGNSGGPLVDAAGDVIGMNTAAATSTGNESASDVGFALPINTARTVAGEIVSGRGGSGVVLGQTAFLGIVIGKPGSGGSSAAASASPARPDPRRRLQGSPSARSSRAHRPPRPVWSLAT